MIRTIPGYSRYTITNNGTVMRNATCEVIRHHSDSKYVWVAIMPDGSTNKQQVNLHVLLAIAFHGPRPDGHVAAFKDGNNRNLTADNIEWVERGALAKRGFKATRRPKSNGACNADSMSLLYETLRLQDAPITMVALADLLKLPYSTVRYSMYGLIAAGKAEATEGGYEAICLD